MYMNIKINTLERLQFESSLLNTGLSFLILIFLAFRPLRILVLATEWFRKRVDHSEVPLRSSPCLGEGGGVT